MSQQKKLRLRIPNLQKVRAELQQEISSRCPLCPNTDVGVFEVHHINEDPADNDRTNLILVCPTCHAKIEKKEIPMTQVRAAKTNVVNTGVEIEFVAATLSENNRSWKMKQERCFYKIPGAAPGNPVISFTLINHFPHTMVMHRIRIFIKSLPSGLAGIPQATTLNSLITYQLWLKGDGENAYPLDRPLQIPAGAAAKFDTELYSMMVGGIKIPPGSRDILHFIFDFNGGISLQAPPIYLNCKAENDPLQIWIIQ